MPFRRAKWYRNAIVFLFGMTAITTAVVGQPSVRAWSGDPSINTPICTNSSDQSWNNLRPNIVGDGSGGAIITWQDYRNGNPDIYARRVDSTGAPLWGADGVAICTAANAQQNPAVVSDGSGGAIIAWQDYRNGNWDIYVQKINSGGSANWTPSDGIVICADSGTQQYPSLVSDGSGGAVITWQDSRSTGIYARRVLSDGTASWTYNGVRMCGATGIQDSPAIVSDGSGGAIIAWQDQRSGNRDVYAQSVNASGTARWTSNGVALCTAANDQQYPTMISDGSGGAIIAWQDQRNGNGDIYSQRASSAGIAVWTANGVALCTAANDQQYPNTVSDGSGGAIMTWQDYRNGNWDIYAQRINSGGSDNWTPSDGIAICADSGTQQYPSLVSDGSAGAVITWQDSRSTGIYAQRVTSWGTGAWTAGGVAISTATGTQQYPSLSTDGDEGAIITWQDYRNGNWDIYAQRIRSSGALPAQPTVTGVSPESGERGHSITGVSITGTYFTGALSVSFGSGVTVDSFTVSSSTSISADITIDTAASTGTRSVSVTTPEGSASLPDCFTVVAAPLEAGFSANWTAVIVGQAVQFTSNCGGGEPPFTYYWDFGDGENSTALNPSHSYGTTGVKTVTLTVTDSAAGTDSTTHDIRVFDPPAAGFSADRTEVIAGQAVHFTDSSSGGVDSLTYKWDFEDNGSWDSTDQNPTHAYAGSGAYTVVFQVTDSASNTATRTDTDYIIVSPAPEADFSADRTDVLAGESIAFTDASSGGVAPLSYAWDFGDGENSTAANPSHSYSSPGQKTVTLTITDSATNTASETKTAYITIRGSCNSVTAASGSVVICTSAGALDNLTAVAESSVSSEGKPDLVFGHGLFEFEVTGLANGDSVTLTMTLPSAVPMTAQYWKYGPTQSDNAPHWYQVAFGDNDGDNVITITLTDGGVGDDDLDANGTIFDQGGPGWPRPIEPKAAPAFPGVYAGITVALGTGVIAYLIRRRLIHL